MNKFFFILFTSCFTYGNVYSQNENLTIENLEDNILYRGHNNLLKITVLGEKSTDVQCLKCDTLYKISEVNNEYIIRPGRNFDVTLKVITKKDTLLKEYQIRSLPEPNLYFGNIESNNSNPFSTIPFDLKVRYDSSVKLSENFEIVSWDFCAKKEYFHGKGNTISKNAHEHLTRLKRNQKIMITVTYVGSDQIRRLLKGYYIIGSKKYRKPQKQPKNIILD